MATEHQSVDTDIADGSSDSAVKEQGLILEPVLENASGEGLPYAPVNWPCPGDVWGWKVGKRKTTTGFMLDRYLYPPWRLQEVMRGKKHFASFQSIKEFVQKEFPDADHDAFFASFSWKVPAKGHYREKDLYLDNPELRISLKCKARNKMCSLQPEAQSTSLPVMECDICCSEPHFCRDCCCILCLRSIDWAHGGYSFIRCEAIMNENSICGHAAHIDCALRSYMAGTVGGSIRLDVEYHCRRCDMRTDLISHVTRLLDTCESLESQDDIKKILKTGLRILRGSHRESATRLLNRIEMALIKLESGIHLKEIWNVEDSSLVVSSGASSYLGKKRMLPGLEDTNDQSPPEQKKAKRSHQPAYITSDHQMECLKLEEEIEQVLQDLRKSQELEFRMAEDKLNAQKHLIGTLYQQVTAERSKLAKRTASTRGSDVDALLIKIMNSVNQIKQEAVKFKDMEKVGKGFGRTPSSVLKEHFGFHIDD